jgi:hypothetical protein
MAKALHKSYTLAVFRMTNHIINNSPPSNTPDRALCLVVGWKLWFVAIKMEKKI